MRILVAERVAQGRTVGESLAGGVIARWRGTGLEVDAVVDGDPLPRTGDVLLLIGNAGFFPGFLQQLRRAPRGERPFVAVWHAEPLPPPRASGLAWPWLNEREIGKILLRDARATDVYSNYLRLRSLHRNRLVDLLIVTSLGRQEFLAERGIPSERVPWGYSPGLGRPLGQPRDIDVLFLGDLAVHRRRRMLGRLEQAGIRVMAVGDWTDPAYWGERRTALINRAKILLNLARTQGELSGLRLLLGMANGALVLSEPIHLPDPYRPDEHFVMAPIDEIPAVAARVLRDDHARERMVDAAYRFITTEVTIEQSADCILTMIRRALAA